MHYDPAFSPLRKDLLGMDNGRTPPVENNLYSYEIDSEDNIVFCSDTWDNFAIENDGEHLAFEQIKGQSIWNHISCDKTVGLYQRIFASARAGKPVQFFLRCDSPTVRRLLHVSVSPTIEGRVRTTTLLFRTDEREPVHTVNCAHGHDPADDCYTLCTWCNKLDAGSWLELEDLMHLRRSEGREAPPPVRHGICDPCHARIDQQLGAAH